MLAKQKTDAVPCIPGALPGGLTRTRFYDGMLLTQVDMEREQTYWRMKRKLTNRALGNGIVWGLRLEWDSSKRLFHLGPGYAIDCCGNDLIVECPQDISERKLVDKNDPEIKAFLSGKTMNTLKCPDPGSVDEPRKACIILQYTECAGDPQPVHEDACTTNVTHCEYSSVRESVKVLLAPPPVEPEPTPMENFCKRIEELREASAADPACTLFDAVDPLASGRFPVNVEIHNTTQNANALLQPEVQEGAAFTITEPIAALETGDDVLINVIPAPGHVFVGGEDASGSGLTIEPFGVQLNTTADALLNPATPAVSLADLTVVSLFNNDTHVQADLTISARDDGAGNAFVTATTNEYVRLPIPPSCNDRLSPLLILNGDPACIGKALALTALAGWFKGMLGNEKTEPPRQVTGKHVFAWWICYIAFKLLYGANLDDPKGPMLAAALQDLLEEWCRAFTYPGPYCRDDHHGVYLGCVEMSPKGNILCFDAWEHRRYVITGPLMTHWASLFGLAPIDVIAGRLAGWICCLSSTSLPAVTGGMAASLIDGLPLEDYGMAVIAGDIASVDAYLIEHALTKNSESSMSLGALAGGVLEMIIKGDSSNRLSLSRDVIAIEGTDLFVLMPARTGRLEIVGRREHEVARLVRARTEELRPLARPLVSRFALEAARSINLDRLSITGDDDVVNVLVGELERNGVTTVYDYLELGPERGARIALARGDELEVDDPSLVPAAAEDLTIAGEAVINAAVDPFAKNRVDTGGGPLLAEHLTQKENVSKVAAGIRKLMRRNALPNKVVKAIAERAAASGRSASRGDE